MIQMSTTFITIPSFKQQKQISINNKNEHTYYSNTQLLATVTNYNIGYKSAQSLYHYPISTTVTNNTIKYRNAQSLLQYAASTTVTNNIK